MADYDLRGLSIEQLFAVTPLRDCCIDAANRATRKFNSRFPGWALYARVVRGETYYDRQLEAWAITCARMLSRAVQASGYPYTRPSARGPWIAASGLDALYTVLGYRAPDLQERAAQLEVDKRTYARIYRPVYGAIAMGLLEYSSELSYQLRQVRREERELMFTSKTGANVGYHDAPRLLASGCARTVPLQDQAGAYADQRETLYPGLSPWSAWDEREATIHAGTASTAP
jgi:hypothetical protein